MPPLATIVFSKDRPMQLDATLRSLRLHGIDQGVPCTSILYKASSPEFEAAYGVLRLQYPDVVFHQETDFKLDLLSVIGDAEHVLFLVDDTIVTAHMPVRLAVGFLDAHQDLIGFSFRLGRNTTHCYALDRAQALPEFAELGDDVLGFDWVAGEHDFGYPLELSSSLYRSADLRPLLGWLSYRNPNSLEDGLASSSEVFATTRPRLGCLSRSVAVSVPANMVQSGWSNRASSQDGLDAASMLRRFERGERVDVSSYTGVTSRSCHQELGFIYSQDSSVPSVSVVIRCGQAGRHLQAVVEGLVEQPYQDWEVVVDAGDPEAVDDAASKVVELFAGHRIRYTPGPGSNAEGAPGHGVASSLGRYILIADEDRFQVPPRLSLMVELLDDDVSYGFVMERDYPPLLRRHLWYRNRSGAICGPVPRAIIVAGGREQPTVLHRARCQRCAALGRGTSFDLLALVA